MEDKTVQQAIFLIEAYYKELASPGDIENINAIELTKILAEIGLCESALHENSSSLDQTTFFKYKNLCKALRNICRAMENDAVAYYKSIRNVVRERVSEEEYLEIVTEAKARIGRNM